MAAAAVGQEPLYHAALSAGLQPAGADHHHQRARRCEEAGYSLNLIVGALDENELLGIYRSGQADATILVEILTHDWRVELLRRHDLRFVMIGRCADLDGLSYVDFDSGAGHG